MNMLEKGECPEGHRISHPDDVMVRRRLEGGHIRVSYRCKECNPGARSAAYESCRFLQLECEHTAVYQPPLPLVGSLAYCSSCTQFQPVTHLGPRAIKNSRGAFEPEEELVEG